MPPDYNDDNTISTDLISSTRRKNKDALTIKNLSLAEELIIQNQDVILMFIEKDHAKVKEMWEWYKDMARKNARWEPRIWQVILFIITLIVGAIAGKFF